MFSLLSFFQSEKSQSGIFHNILSLIRKIATSCTSGINKVDGVMRHMTARISQWQYQAVKHYRNKSYPIRSFINRFVSPTPARYHRIEYARWYDANTDANPSKLPFDSLYKSFLFFELIGIMIDNTIISITKFLLVYPLVTINNLLVNAMVNTRLGQFILLPILEETFNNQHNYYSFHDFDRDQELVTWQSKHTCDIADFVPNSIGFKEDGYELDELINRAIERFRPIAYLNDFLLSFTKQVLANGTVNTLRRLIINILNLLITSVVIVGLELFNMLIKPALIAIADRLCFIANIVINGVTEGCNILLRAIPIIWSYIKYPSIIVFFGIMYMTNPLVFWIVTGSVASVIGTVVLIRAYKKLAELSNRYIPERIRTVLKNLAIFLYKDIITQAFDLVIGFFGLIKSLSTIPFVSIIKSIYAISIEIKDIIAADFAYSKTTTPVISVDTVANNAKSSVEHIENADATQLEIKAIISEVNTLSNISETSEQASTAVTEEIKTPKEPLSVINTNAEPTEQKQDSNPKLELKLNPEPELNIADNTLTEITLSKPNQSTESFAMLGIGPFELSYQPKSNDNEFIAISRYKGFELSYNATQGRKYYELFCNKEVPHYLTQGIHHQKLYFDWIQRNVQNAANLSDLLLSIAGTFSFNPGIINQYFHDNKYKLMCYILNKDDITQIIIEDRKYVYNMILNPEYYLSNNIDAAVYLAINASGSYNNSRWIASIISSTPIAALLNQVKTIIKAKFITEFVLGLPLEFEKFIGNLKPRKQPKITKIIHRFAAVSTLRYQWFGHLWKHHYQIESLQWIGMVASWGPNLKIFGVNLFPTLSFGYAATTIKNFEKLYNNNKETIKANSAQFTLLTVFCLLMATTWSARSYSYTPATIPALNVYYDMFLYPLLTWMIIKEGLAENIMSIYYKGGIKKILSKNAMHIIADSKSDTNNDLARADNTPMGLPDQFVTVISVYGYFIANMLSNASKLMPPFSVQIFKHNSYILIAMMMLALSKTNIFHIDPIYLYLLKNAADIYVANSSIVYKSDTSPFHHPSMYLFLLDTTLLGVASRAALMYGATWSKQLYFKAHPKNEQSKEQKAQNASTQRQFYGLTLALAIFLCAYAFGIHKALPFANQHSLAQYTIMPMINSYSQYLYPVLATSEGHLLLGLVYVVYSTIYSNNIYKPEQSATSFIKEQLKKPMIFLSIFSLDMKMLFLNAFTMSIALYFQALVLDRRYVSQQYRTTSKKEENNLASIHQVFDPEIQAMRISNEASLENNSTSIVPDTRNIAQKWLETIIIPEADDIDFYSMLSQNVHADFIQGTVLGHPTFKTAEKWCLEHRIRTMIKEDLAIQSANNNTDRVISENTKYLKLLHDHIMPTSPNYNPKDSELRARYMSDIKNYIQQPETTADSNNLFDTAEQVEAINKIRNEIINQMNVRESEIDLNQWEGDRIQLEYKNIRDYLQQQHSDCEQALKKAIYCILSHITLHSDRKKALIKNIIDIIEQQKDSFADDASLAVKNIEDSLYSFIAITLISELSIRSFVTEHTIANAPKILNTAESSKPEHSKRKEAAKKYYNTLSYLTVIIPLLLLINYIARVLPGLTSYTKQPKPNTQQPIRTNTFSYEITDYRIEMLSQAGQQVLNTHRLAYPGSYEQLKQLSSPGSAQVITFNNMKYECYNEIAQPISHDGNITTPQSTLESWDVLQYENPSQVSLVLNNKAGQFQLYATCFEQYTAQYKRNTITKNKNIVEYLLPSNHSDFVQNKAYTQPITEIITWLSSTALVRTLLQYPGSIEELHHLQGAGNFQEIQINGEQFTCAVDGKSKIVENWNVLKSDIGAWNSLLDRTENRPVKLIQFSGNTAYSLSARCTREKPLKMKQSQKPLTQQVKMLSNILHNIEATLSPADIIPATGHILSEPLKPVQVVNYLLDGLYYNTVLYPVYAAINWFVFPVSEIHSIISFIPTQYHVTDWDFYQYAKKNSNHYASAWAQTVLYQKYGQQLKKHSTAVHVMSQHITDRMNIFIDILKLLAYYIVFTVVLSAIRKNKAQLPKDTEQEKNITAEKNQSFEKDTLFTEYVISPVQGFLNHPYEKLIDVSRKEYAPMVFSAAANFSTTNLSTPAIVFTLYSIDTLAQGFKGAPKRAHLSND